MIEWMEAPYFEELPDDTVIWHYFSLEKFLALITNSSLHLTRLDQFKDKAEVLVSDIEKKRYPPSFIESIQQERERVFASCWINADNEVSTMWGSFAPSNSGLALKTTIGRLMKCYHGDRGINLMVVKYIDHRTQTVQQLSDWVNDYFFLSTKRIYYKTENEVRLIYRGERNTKMTGLEIPVSINELIDEYILGQMLLFGTRN